MTNTITTTQDRVAILGAGTIGSAMARNIAQHGFRVTVWNRTREKTERLASDGIDIADTPAEAVNGAAIVLTVLNDGPTTSEVIRNAAPGLATGTVWAQMGTVGIEDTQALAAFADEHGAIFYDSPVMGSRQPAEQGQLVIVASGPTKGCETIQPIYDAIGKRTVWVDDDGAKAAGSRLKLALNHYVFTLTHGIAESLSIARGLNVDPSHVIDILSGGPLDSGYLQMKGAAILTDDFTPSFSIANALKDARLIAEAAKNSGVKADVAEANVARFQRAFEQGHGQKDMAASFLAHQE